MRLTIVLDSQELKDVYSVDVLPRRGESIILEDPTQYCLVRAEVVEIRHLLGDNVRWVHAVTKETWPDGV